MQEQRRADASMPIGDSVGTQGRINRSGCIRIHFATRFYETARLGIGKYERSLFAELRQYPCVDRCSVEPFSVPPGLLRLAKHGGRDLQAVSNNFPLRVASARDRLDLIHFSNELLAPGLLANKSRGIITVHHLPHLRRYHGNERYGNLWWYDLLVIASLRRAVRVIAISEWSARDLMARLHVSRDHIDVIPQGVDHRLFGVGGDTNEARTLYDVATEDTILYVGGYGPRKNLGVLAQAFRRLRADLPSAQLLLVGPIDLTPSGVTAEWLCGLDGCRILGYVPDSHLAALYRLASVVVMPSRLEGFSLPTVEAMACGSPVIAARAAALPEVVGDAGLMFDPDDPRELSGLLLEVLTKPDLRRALGRRSRERAERFDWSRTATMTVDTYRRAAPHLFVERGTSCECA